MNSDYTIVVAFGVTSFGIIFLIIAACILLGPWQAKKMKMIHEGGCSDPMYDWWHEKVSPQISLRLELERGQSRGANVWFSRRIEEGRFHHCMLIIDDTKYELRRDQQNNQYYVDVAPCGLNHERRNAALEKQLCPKFNGQSVFLIGWTRKGKDEVSRIALLVGQGWDYDKHTNNCQHYLKILSDQILVEEKAADYPWFYDNVKTEFQNSRMPHQRKRPS